MSNSNSSNMCSRRTQNKKNQARALSELAMAHHNHHHRAPTSPAAPTPGGALHDKHMLMRKQLALLFHAQKCAQRQCQAPHCDTMKSVVVHMNQCSSVVQQQSPYIEDQRPVYQQQHQQKCAVPYCASSRAILVHWKNCATRDQCVICEPVAVTVTPVAESAPVQVRTLAKQPPVAQFRHCSWTGSMEWHQRSKALQNMRNATMSCQVFTAGSAPLNTACWPDKLHLKLIPAQIVDQVSGSGSLMATTERQNVLLKFGQADTEAELRAALKQGSYGYVHFDSTGPAGGVGCPLKMLILTYDEGREAFIGCLPAPAKQKEFVKRLRHVVHAQIQNQQQNHNGMAGVLDNSGLISVTT